FLCGPLVGVLPWDIRARPVIDEQPRSDGAPKSIPTPPLGRIALSSQATPLSIDLWVSGVISLLPPLARLPAPWTSERYELPPMVSTNKATLASASNLPDVFIAVLLDFATTALIRTAVAAMARGRKLAAGNATCSL